MPTPILSVNDLALQFETRHGCLRAVNGVSFTLNKGEILGVVGESGSGKTVTFLSLLGLLPTPPARVVSGSAVLAGTTENEGAVDLLKCSSNTARSLRGRRIAMIFQDPMTALNPYMTIGDQVAEPLLIHKLCNKSEAQERALMALEEVGISDGKRRLKQYPHEFSGGMRQRVMIAMALITRPDILIADEPTTALDVTVQAQILELLRERQNQLGTSVIFITHNLGVVASLCDRVAVFYAGQIVETATTESLFRRSRHPYTEALHRAIPKLDGKGSIEAIGGTPPDLRQRLSGCAFAPRCVHANDRCRNDAIQLRDTGGAHYSSCIRHQLGEI